jgi:hypothetical protein
MSSQREYLEFENDKPELRKTVIRRTTITVSFRIFFTGLMTLIYEMLPPALVAVRPYTIVTILVYSLLVNQEIDPMEIQDSPLTLIHVYDRWRGENVLFLGQLPLQRLSVAPVDCTATQGLKVIY